MSREVWVVERGDGNAPSYHATRGSAYDSKRPDDRIVRYVPARELEEGDEVTLDLNAIESRYIASGLTPDAHLIDSRLSERLGGGWYLGVSKKKDGDSIVNSHEPLRHEACAAIVAYAEDVPALVAEVRQLRETIETLKAHLGGRR